MAFCPNCGASLPEGSAFCTSCGAPLAPVPQQDSPFPPQQSAAPAGYPSPMGYPAPAPKKKHTGLIIGIVAAVLVIGIVIGVLFLTGVLGGGSNGAASAIQPTPTPTPTPTPAPTIIGTWELTQRTENGEDYPYDAVAQLTFEEGGTGFIYDDGYEDELSWDDSTFTLYGETVYYTFTDDELLFSLYDMSFVFSRISYVPYERQNSSYGDDDGELSYATDFALMDRYGYYYSLSDFYGKPIIINFWATSCGPCQMELPYFNDAYLQYGDQIQFLIVDVSYETESDTISFVDSNGYVFPVFFDYDSQGSLFYNVEYIPLTVVIDADGRIVDTHEGSMSQAELQALIDKLL